MDFQAQSILHYSILANATAWQAAHVASRGGELGIKGGPEDFEVIRCETTIGIGNVNPFVALGKLELLSGLRQGQAFTAALNPQQLVTSQDGTYDFTSRVRGIIVHDIDIFRLHTGPDC